MELLEKAITEKGKVLPGNVLKVGAILNNRMDVKLLSALAEDIAAHFGDKGVTDVLTVEASGIALAVLVAEKLGVDALFAKKSKTANVEGEVYSAECYSYTHKKSNTLIVPAEYLEKGAKVLIVDDFLANGEALNALIDIVKQAGAETVGCAVAVEKGFQGGGDKLRAAGMDVYSLAIVESMENGKVVFRRQK